MKTIINEQYDDNLVINSLNITFYIMLLMFYKIHSCDSYDQNQRKYIVKLKYIQNPKRKVQKPQYFVSDPYSCLFICKQKIVFVIQHLKNSVCIINQCLCHLLKDRTINFINSNIF